MNQSALVVPDALLEREHEAAGRRCLIRNPASPTIAAVLS
jgi:hypothetical protein